MENIDEQTERMPANYLDDSEWIRENLDELDAQYHMRWIAVYHREVVGVGDTQEEALRVGRETAGPDATPYLELITRALLGGWRVIREDSRVDSRQSQQATKLTLNYDREADILHINTRLPYASQETEELGDDVIARFNPKTNEIENLEVLFFSTRLLRNTLFELPIEANLRLATRP